MPVFCLVLALGAGCATPGPRAPAPPPLRAQGTVIRVNAGSGFVVAECAILPSPGEEARVLRNGLAVGRIRFVTPARFPYITADVLEGRPAVGDVFQLDAPMPAPQAE